AGSGYTARTLPIDSVVSGQHGLCKLNISRGAEMGIGPGEGGAYVYITGTGVAALDNQVIRIADDFGDRTVWHAQGITFPGGTFTGGTLYWPYTVSFDSGSTSGQDFTADVLVGPS